MPIRHTDKGWYWGQSGPFTTKAKALSVARAAYSSGYKEAEQMSSVGEFIGTLLHSGTITHVMHLQAKGQGSYAAHKALGEFYPAIPDLVDGLAESIQGLTGELIDGYPNVYAAASSDPLQYMVSLQNYVKDNRDALPADSEIQNDIDSIATLINSTVYKLKFLA